MEELRQRLVAETTLTAEQVETAMRVISPYQQQELLQLPSQELEAKTRALAAIPSARPLALRRPGSPMAHAAAAPPEAPAPALAPGLGLKRPGTSAPAAGLVAPQASALVPPGAKLVAPQGPQLVAPAAVLAPPPLVAAPVAPPPAAVLPEPPPPAAPEAKSNSFKSDFTPLVAETEVATRSPLAVLGFAAAMLLGVTVAAWGLSRNMPKDRPHFGDHADVAVAKAGDPALREALRPQGGALRPMTSFTPPASSSLVRCAFLYQHQLEEAELQAVKDKGCRIEMWLALEDLPGKCQLAALDDLALGLDATGQVECSYPGGSLSCPKVLPADGSFFHLRVEFEAAKVRLYVNGKLRDEGKSKSPFGKGMFTAGSPEAKPGVLIDQMLLSYGSDKKTAPQHPLQPGEDMLCYLPFEASGPGVYLRQGSSEVPLKAGLLVAAEDRLKALQTAVKTGTAAAFTAFQLPPLDPASAVITPVTATPVLVDVTPHPGDSPFLKAWREYAAMIQAKVPKANFGLNPGASADQISRFEAAVGHPLTAEFRDLYQLANGQREDGMSLFRPEEFRLLSLEESYQLCAAYRGMAGKDPDVFLESDFNQGEVKDINRWNTAWIPVAREGGRYLCLDFDPTSKGRPGQLIWVDPGYAGAEFYAVSALAAMEKVTSAVKSGAMKFGPDGSGPWTAEELQDFGY